MSILKIASFDVGIKNLALCVVNTNEKILLWEILDISASSNKLICKNMVKQLDEIDLLKNIDVVLVEQQPRFNNKMRIVQGYLDVYFTIRAIDNGINPKIISYSPKHKLNCYDGETPDYTHLKSQYNQRKKIAVFHTQELIKNTQDVGIIQKFENSKKKDDYSDSYLQSLSYIRYNDDKTKKIVLGKVNARSPTKKQIKYKRFSRSNLKYLLVEDLKKCLCDKDRKALGGYVDIQCKKFTIDEFLKEWIKGVDGIKKNILSLYDDYNTSPDSDYSLETVKKDLVPEIYIKSLYTLEFK